MFSQAELAIKAISENANLPDYIFLDINMPVMDGWEFMDELSKMATAKLNNLHIYILTSSLDPSDYSKAELSPLIQGFISKPLEIEKVEFLKN